MYIVVHRRTFAANATMDANCSAVCISINFIGTMNQLQHVSFQLQLLWQCYDFYYYYYLVTFHKFVHSVAFLLPSNPMDDFKLACMVRERYFNKNGFECADWSVWLNGSRGRGVGRSVGRAQQTRIHIKSHAKYTNTTRWKSTTRHNTSSVMRHCVCVCVCVCDGTFEEQ